MDEHNTKENYDDLIRVFEDFQHQIKSPIAQAHIRARRALTGELSGEEARTQMQAIRGLCGKARQITSRIGLFVSLSRGNQIQVNLSELKLDELIKIIKETAEDNQLMIEPSRQIRYQIDQESFDGLKSCRVVIDYDLLEQALRSILDNAGKYSYSDSLIRISGGLTQQKNFYISVVNRGIRIRADQVRNCLERGWRSEEAKATTGEGSGLGLWIVDNIMKAQAAELMITPTTSNGVTDVRLVFLCEK